MLYEIHMLKNYPPTNLNRDDTGAPKTCLFGNTLRSRISSQCLKHSWRTSDLLKSEMGAGCCGIRTRRLPQLIKEELLLMGVSADMAEAIMPKIAGLCDNKEEKEEKQKKAKKGKETEKPEEPKEEKEEVKDEKEIRTSQVVFYSPEDIAAVTNSVYKVLSECKDAKEAKKLPVKKLKEAINGAKTRPITLDIALFGRMVTCNSFRDVDASMQVAHAISTNKVSVESDFFTALDEVVAGNMKRLEAGILGETDYNSSCYYVYVAIDTDILEENLSYAEDPADVVRKAIPAILRTMAFTNPSGKQNSFAGHMLPSAMMIECKTMKVPTSMANAYVEPVHGVSDAVAESINRLADEADMISRNYGIPVKERLWFCVDKYKKAPATATKTCKSLSELVDAVSATL